MIQSSRTFHIFVSSSFSDLKAARNALVFPRLHDLAPVAPQPHHLAGKPLRPVSTEAVGKLKFVVEQQLLYFHARDLPD